MQGLGGGLFNTPAQTGTLGGGLGRGTTGGLGLGGGGAATGGGLFGNRPGGGGLFGNTGGGGGLGGTGGGGGLFGQNTQTQTGGGLFNTAGGGGLGGGTGGGLFQTPASQTGLGAQQKAGLGGGLFGQSPALGGGGLGGTTGGGLFGQTAQTGTTGGGGGLFAKSQTPASGIGGGLFKTGLGGGLGGMLGAQQLVKFEPIKAKDTANKNGVTYNVDTLLHCITGMTQYEQKSLEELRLDDYVAGRKGSTTTGGTTGAGGLFAGGQAAGLGGAATTGGLAGAGGGLFGQNKSIGGGLFNQQQTLGGLGGATLGGGGLGATATAGGLFQQQQQQQQNKLGGGGLFGNQTKLGGLGGLGASTATGGLFNQQTSQATAGGIFGNQSAAGGAGGLFAGQQQSTGLGGLGGGGGLLGQQTQLGGGGLFNRTSTAGGLGLNTGLGGLGATSTGLGTGLGGGGLGGLGGLSQAGTGLFNKPLQTGTLGTGLGLGGGASQLGVGLGGTGLGGGTALGGTTGLGLGTGLSTGLGQNRLGLGGTLGIGALGNQNQAANLLSLESKKEELNSKLESLANQPFGDSPLFRSAFLEAAKRNKSKEGPAPISAKATPTHSPHYKLNMRPSARFKPMSLRSPARHLDKSKLFESLEDSQQSTESGSIVGGARETFVPRRSIKKLTIKPKPQPDSTTPPHSEEPSPVPRPQSWVSPANSSNVPSTNRPAFEVTPTRGTPPNSTRSKDTSMESPELSVGVPKQLIKPTPVRVTHTLTSVATPSVTSSSTASPSGLLRRPLVSNGASPPPTSSTTAAAAGLTRPPLHTEGEGQPPSQRFSGAVMLTKLDYYTVPPCDELDEMIQDGCCEVEGFTIGRRGYGEIHFPDKTDVYGMNLDQLVLIDLKEVQVYPDDEDKPPVGKGLNKTAIVRLERNWPIDKTTREEVTDPERIEKMGYVNKLKRSTAKIGGTFIDYFPETGTCVFQVEHFSKYKLSADDDDSEGEEPGREGGVVKKQKTQQAAPGGQNGVAAKPAAVVPSQPLASGQPRIRLDDDETMSDDDEYKDAVDESVATEPHPLPVLPSQQLASSMGVSTHRVQVMKASFFGAGEEGERVQPKPFLLGSSQPPLFQTTTTPSSLLGEHQMATPLSAAALQLSSSSSRRHTPLQLLSSRMHWSGSGRTTPTSSLTLAGPIDKPSPLPHPAISSMQAQAAVIMAKHNLSLLVPPTRSLVSDKTSNMADAGLMLGHSFRVGWGPNWTLAHSGFQISGSTDSRSFGLFSAASRYPGDGEGLPLRVLVEQVHIGAPERTNPTTPKQSMSELFLSSQLELSTFTTAADDDDGTDSAPHIAPPNGHTLLEKFADLSRLLRGDPVLSDVATQQQLKRVLKLATVLWGPLSDDIDPDPGCYDNQRARRRGVYEWLRETNESVTLEEVGGCSEENYLRALFSLVSGQQLGKACRLAHRHRDHKLAMLLSQAAQNTTYNRTYLLHQLNEWEREKATEFIDYDRLKLYVLLAGLMVWEVAGVREVTGVRGVNVCEKLDWKRALALHLCYGCGLTAPVREVVDKYNNAFQDDDAYAPPPLPPYLEDKHETTPTSDQPLDTCYHMLQLYCYRDYGLEVTLAPSGSTPSQLDYRISWFLLSLLTSLDYTHLHPTKLAQFHMSFACQLERSGLWWWAIFVILHVEQPALREAAVRRVLGQHCTSDEELTEQETFVVEKLHVSRNWVYEAKGQSAGYELNYELQALHFLKAERWNDCHTVIMNHLAADAIVNDDTDLLLELLEELSAPSSCALVQGWDQAGSVFLDYLHISSQMVQLAEDTEQLSGYLLEQLQSGLEKLAFRISHLPCLNPTQVLCQSELSKKTANYARVVATLKVESGLAKQVDMTTILPHLPMPSDYCIAEFSTLLQPYLHELGSHY